MDAALVSPGRKLSGELPPLEESGVYAQVYHTPYPQPYHQDGSTSANGEESRSIHDGSGGSGDRGGGNRVHKGDYDGPSNHPSFRDRTGSVDELKEERVYTRVKVIRVWAIDLTNESFSTEVEIKARWVSWLGGSITHCDASESLLYYASATVTTAASAIASCIARFTLAPARRFSR